MPIVQFNFLYVPRAYTYNFLSRYLIILFSSQVKTQPVVK